MTQSRLLLFKAPYCRRYVRYECPEQHFNCKLVEIVFKRMEAVMRIFHIFCAGERRRRLKHNHIIVLDRQIREYYELLQGFSLIYPNLQSSTSFFGYFL
jgi:hypothetical protein